MFTCLLELGHHGLYAIQCQGILLAKHLPIVVLGPGSGAGFDQPDNSVALFGTLSQLSQAMQQVKTSS